MLPPHSQPLLLSSFTHRSDRRLCCPLPTLQPTLGEALPSVFLWSPRQTCHHAYPMDFEQCPYLDPQQNCCSIRSQAVLALFSTSFPGISTVPNTYCVLRKQILYCLHDDILLHQIKILWHRGMCHMLASLYNITSFKSVLIWIRKIIDGKITCLFNF